MSSGVAQGLMTNKYSATDLTSGCLLSSEKPSCRAGSRFSWECVNLGRFLCPQAWSPLQTSSSGELVLFFACNEYIKLVLKCSCHGYQIDYDHCRTPILKHNLDFKTFAQSCALQMSTFRIHMNFYRILKILYTYIYLFQRSWSF